MALRFLACATGNMELPFTETQEGLGRVGLGGAE